VKGGDSQVANVGKVLFWITVAIVLAAFLWFVPQYQGQHFSQGVPSKEVPTLVNEYRRTWAQILGGAALLLGLYFTWRGQRLTQQSLEDTRASTDETLRLTREEQITDRFTKAIEQLGQIDHEGKKVVEVRLGGLYALEQIARESQPYYWPIMQIMGSYVKHHAPLDPEVQLGDHKETKLGHTNEDIQAVIDIVGRRAGEYNKEDKDRIDLEGTSLLHTSFTGGNFTGAWFRRADLRRSHFGYANLREASFVGADLRQAIFNDVRNLEGVSFDRANLEGTSVKGANLEGATGLSQEQIDQTTGDQNTKLPHGIRRPAHWSSNPDAQLVED